MKQNGVVGGPHSHAIPWIAGPVRLAAKNRALWLVGLLACLLSPVSGAVTLQATEDSYGVPFAEPLQVETFGVLENDLLDGISAGQAGAVAELVQGPAYGSLDCPSSETLTLCPDGAFHYSPGSGFPGMDSFSYRLRYGAEVSAVVSVGLTACSGGPELFACWQESSFLAKLAEFGYVSFTEDFEGSAWSGAREPQSAASITSNGVVWRSNHPQTNNLTTGPGAAHSGNYGLYDPEHGAATGSILECDIDNPPDYCLFYDGFSGSRVAGEGALHGVGGFFSGTAGASLEVILDDWQSVGLGKIPATGPQFFGVISRAGNGFSTYEIREQDGKVGQRRIIFGDDVTFAASSGQQNAPPLADAGTGRAVEVATRVILDGSGSRDEDGDALSFRWSLLAVPAGSKAYLSDPLVVNPAFTADLAGDYLVQLIVSDGHANSTPVSVSFVAVDTGSVTPPDSPDESGEVTGSSGGGGELWLTFLALFHVLMIWRRQHL